MTVLRTATKLNGRVQPLVLGSIHWQIRGDRPVATDRIVHVLALRITTNDIHRLEATIRTELRLMLQYHRTVQVKSQQLQVLPIPVFIVLHTPGRRSDGRRMRPAHVSRRVGRVHAKDGGLEEGLLGTGKCPVAQAGRRR